MSGHRDRLAAQAADDQIRQQLQEATTARAAAIAAQAHVRYWVVLSYQDGLDLLAGIVPPAIRPQLLAVLKRGRAESAEEYAARVSEAEVIPAHVKTSRGGLVIE